MRVSELSVTDISEAVLLVIVPSVSELGQPGERLRIVHFVCDQLGNNITRVHVNSTDCHNLLSVTMGQITKQHGNQGIQLVHL